MPDILGRLGIPESWQFYLASFGAMLALAGLDFAGAIFAKEWTARHHGGLFLGGLACFVVLFVVYARILETAELSVVTIGWVVFLQVGLLLVDRLRYGVELPPAKWAAVALILILQAYLVLAPNSSADETAASEPSSQPVGASAAEISSRLSA